MSASTTVRDGPGRRLLTLVVSLALACLGLVAAPAAHAASYGPGSLTVTPASATAGSSGATLVMRYTAPSTSGFAGAVTVVVPTSGAPATGFRPLPAASNVRVARGTCSAAALAPSPFGPVTKSGYPGDSPGTRISVIARCAAGKSFTVTYAGVTVPRTAQRYTFWTTAGGSPLRVQPVVTVTPQRATTLAVSAPASAVAGTSFTLRVVAKDRYGNTATGYRGTVRFSTTDPLARVLPGPYTFTSGDQGVHRFAVTLVADGARRIDVADNACSTIRGSDTLAVTNAGVTVWGSVLYDFDPFGFAARVDLVDAVSRKVLRRVELEPWESAFSFARLPAGAFTIRVTSPGFVTAPATGVPVAALAPGQDSGWTEVEMVDNPADRAAVEGQVLSGMDPLPVQAWVFVWSVENGMNLGTVQTDAEGHYRIENLPPVAVVIDAQAPGYLQGWANDKDSLAEADVFTLVSGQTLTQSWDPESFGPYLDLNPVPVAPAAIEGEVLSSMDPISGEATVTVYDAATGTALASVQTVDQHYRIEGLAPGEVKVGADAEHYLEGFANNVDTLAAAQVFTLVAGQTLTQSWGDPFGPYLDLDPDPLSWARLEGWVLSNMDPLPVMATVTVYDAATGEPLASVSPGGGGSGYYLLELSPGQVKIGATAPGYLPGFANNVDSLAEATVFTLVGGQTLTQSWADPFGPYLDLDPEPSS